MLSCVNVIRVITITVSVYFTRFATGIKNSKNKFLQIFILLAALSCVTVGFSIDRLTTLTECAMSSLVPNARYIRLPINSQYGKWDALESSRLQRTGFVLLGFATPLQSCMLNRCNTFSVYIEWCTNTDLSAFWLISSPRKNNPHSAPLLRIVHSNTDWLILLPPSSPQPLI